METKTIRANKARLINGSVIPSYKRIMQTAQYEHFNVSMEEWNNTNFKNINSTTRILNTTNNEWLFQTPSAVMEDETLKNSRRLPTIETGNIEIGRYMNIWYTPINFRGVTSRTYIFKFSSTATQFRFGTLSIYNPTNPALNYMDSYVNRNNELLSSGSHILVAKITSAPRAYYYIDGVRTSKNHSINLTGNPLYWFFYNMSSGTLNISSIEVIDHEITDTEISQLE